MLSQYESEKDRIEPNCNLDYRKKPYFLLAVRTKTRESLIEREEKSERRVRAKVVGSPCLRMNCK